MLSTLGRSVDEEIGIISSYDEEMQAKVWAGLASQASVPFDACVLTGRHQDS